MKIILVGQGPFGEKVLDTLFRQGEHIVGVFCPQDKMGAGMAKTAEGSGVPLFRPRKMKDAEVSKTFVELSPDLVILAFVTDIITEALLNIPSIGTICYHPSLLPKHRGSSAINWAVIQGDTRTGLTILWADKGIDTGPILLQKEIEIAPDDTTGTLYFNKLFDMGIDAIVEAVKLIKSGTASKLPQDDSLATYEPTCDETFAKIEWSKPAREVYNLIRGCDPQPGAYSTLKDQKVKFYDALLSEFTSETSPGQVINIGAEEVVVALNGGALKIGKMKGAKGTKLFAADYAKEIYLKAGMRFGS
ncbi:MAG: methionyl-tRNA formyltransferase [Deltaproteobacteria bacterium]|nr:methionyl-tRNA formyltransferase [Deltaproteobacteria bacterium]